MSGFTILYVLLLVTMLSLLVAAHELGHFLFARLFKMDVEEFAIGFGRPQWVYRVSKGTEYSLRPFPLGGFVRIKGMMPEEDGNEVNVPNGFYSKPPHQRFLVLLAGPVFSILAGLAILIPLHTLYGIQTLGTTIDEVTKGSAAEQAHLIKGDKLLTFGNKPLVTFFDAISYVRDKGGQPIPVTFRRNGAVLSTTVTPKLDDAPSDYLESIYAPTATRQVRQAKIGIRFSPQDRVLVQVPVGLAVQTALMWPVEMVKGLAGMVLRPSTFSQNVGGPATIVTESYAAAKNGWDSFLSMVALLSISLGIFNLLPLGPLDGGQMLIAVAEMFRKRRLSMNAQSALAGIGTALLFMLIIGVVIVDVQRLMTPKQESPTVSPPKSSSSSPR